MGIRRDHGRARVCTRCGGRGCELIDPYLENWMADQAQDTISFHSRLDERRQRDRELARLRQLKRVRQGLESTGDILINALNRSSAWERHGSYRELRRALDRLRACFPSIAHNLVWYDVYHVHGMLSDHAQRSRELGLRLLSRWMPEQIEVPSWLSEGLNGDKIETVQEMVAAGWKAKRVARSLKISQGKAKRLVRAARAA